MGMSGSMPHDTNPTTRTPHVDRRGVRKEVAMRKFVTIGTVALLATMGIVTSVSADAGEPRTPAEEPPGTFERISDLPAAIGRLERSSDRISALLEKEAATLGRVNCTTMKCLNEKLTDLTRFAKKTAARLKALDQAWDDWYWEWNNCAGTVLPMTQYNGYMYSFDGMEIIWPVTALDVTEEGGEADAYALLWTCDVT
jgi:hypothetical protein